MIGVLGISSDFTFLSYATYNFKTDRLFIRQFVVVPFFSAHHFIFIFPKSQQPEAEVAVLVLQDADLQAV